MHDVQQHQAVGHQQQVAADAGKAAAAREQLMPSSQAAVAAPPPPPEAGAVQTPATGKMTQPISAAAGAAATPRDGLLLPEQDLVIPDSTDVVADASGLAHGKAGLATHLLCWPCNLPCGALPCCMWYNSIPDVIKQECIHFFVCRRMSFRCPLHALSFGAQPVARRCATHWCCPSWPLRLLSAEIHATMH
jgi:hypothetical protein